MKTANANRAAADAAAIFKSCFTFSLPVCVGFQSQDPHVGCQRNQRHRCKKKAKKFPSALNEKTKMHVSHAYCSMIIIQSSDLFVMRPSCSDLLVKNSL